jgi:hypothetical protein
VLQFLNPAVFWIGAALGAVPVALHLIAQRPAERAPLPTARFLAVDARTRLRLRRVPSDVALLAVRTLFILLLTAAFAAPVLVPERTGTATVVLLDAGATMAPVWAASVDSARARLLGAERVAALVVFDEQAAVFESGRIDAALFDSIAAAGPHATPADYAVAFATLRTLAPRLETAESAAVTLVTRPRWEAWSEGLAPVRNAAWPGAVELVTLDAPDAALTSTGAASGDGARGTAVVVAAPGQGRYAEAALTALGYDAVVSTDVAAALPQASVVLLVGGDAPQAALLDRAETGATLVVAGMPGAGPLQSALPWEAQPDASSGRGGDLLFHGGPRLAGAPHRYIGRPVAGARVVAVWEDGSVAAAAAPYGRGCVVYLATALEGGKLPVDPEFPHAVERLGTGCSEPRHDGVGPLDTGGVQVLAGGSGDAVIALAALGAGDAARPLSRWLLVAALALAALEAGLAYGRRRHA